MPDRSSVLRRALVADLEKRRQIKTAPVRKAFLAVPRELFVADRARQGGLEAVYKDLPIVTKTDPNGAAISSSSQPSIMAIMLEALRLGPGQRILEVGAGTGYNAALMSRVVGVHGSVTSIDIDPELAARAKVAIRKGGFRASVMAGDGRTGWPKGAPYDRIVVTASSDFIPVAWWRQLVADGLLEVPFRLLEGGAWAQSVIVFEKTDDGFRSIDSNPGGFMGLRGGPDEESPIVSPASVDAFERSRNSGRTFAHVSGNGLRGTTTRDKRELLRLLMGDPRSYDVAGKTQTNALRTFLTLRLPRRALVTFARHKSYGVGVVSPDLDSVAAAVANSGKTRVECYGTRTAQRILEDVLAEWRSMGSPGDRSMRITVSFDGRPDVWHALRRKDCIVGIDWLRPRTRARR